MEDRRAEHRQKVLKVGKVIFNGQNCLYDCRIRDLTAAGARLRIEHSWQVPERFGFVDTSRGQGRRPARVVWRGDTELGITFDDAA